MKIKEDKEETLIEEVQWRNIREKVHKANAKFAKKIDSIDPQGEFVLYLVKYPFGSMIIEKGVFYLPYNGKYITLNDSNCPQKIRTQLAYNSGGIPLSFLLNHSTELYVESERSILSPLLYKKGEIFGLRPALNLPYTIRKVWNMVSGTRSIFLLPKITDTHSYKKLSKARNIKLPMPKSLFDHGLILKQIAGHSGFEEKWYSELLLFPANYMKPHKGESWTNFRLFLYEEAIKGMGYAANKEVYRYMWHSLMQDLTHQNIKILPYIMDAVEHIIEIGLGITPGFIPATDNELGPIESFKKDFIEIYGLKHFAPTIMVPKHMSETDGRFVYCSMQLPIYFETNPRPKAPNSVLSNLKEIKFLLDRLREAISLNKVSVLLDTPFYNFMKKVRFDFFHSDINSEEEGIRPSYQMPKEDKNLIKCSSQFGRRGFSEVSPFVRGCVRIGFKPF